jgi:hypothetical protein
VRPLQQRRKQFPAHTDQQQQRQQFPAHLHALLLL